jgi:hypothetical protein
MKISNERIQKYYEILIQNQQKGEIYTIRFRNETPAYTGIPMITHNMQQNNDSMFVFNVLSPEEFKGIHERYVKDIESIENYMSKEIRNGK